MINVILLGLISFFADVSTEMVYPLIPLYLTAVFGATPVLIGIIEGIAESLASLLRVFSGYLTDRYQHKKPLAFAGYSTGLIYKIALVFATSWVGVLAARVIDRIGKGIRTSPRDVMVYESANKDEMGRAFGIHKALDMAGTALGILAAYFLIRAGDGSFDYKYIFVISMVPTVICLGLFFFVRERPHRHDPRHFEPFWKNMSQLDGQLKLYLAVAFIFTLGNSSNTFLLLRARNVGFSDASVILLYFIYSVTASVLAIPLGHLSDKIGRKKLLVAGYLVFSLVYLGFALALSKSFMVGIFILYGLHTALITGIERAYVAEISPPTLKGTMLGLHSTLVGIALLPASAVAGLLWNLFGAPVPFLFGSALSLTAAFILFFLMKNIPANRVSEYGQK